ncbi:MAG: UV DNA damage repair endonuclease UvsE [Chloroflexi bacterium]|nr:UV DNA damage repair endonuclease UvsE [Chloroflexota bacterium]
MRLGFAVKALGEPGLKSHDARRWQNRPHLSVSLAYLRDLFAYLQRAGIGMYRMSSDLAPYVTHPEMPQFHGQIEECAPELAALGQTAREQGLRLSFHPSQYVVLNTPDDGLAARSAADIETQASILEGMGLGSEAVVVLHVGGLYGDRGAAREWFARRFEGLLTPMAQRRLVLENDEKSFGLVDTYWIHQRTGIRLVFDNLHHQNNPGDLPMGEALALALSTWPADQRPKAHFSSPRTEARVVRQPDPAGGRPVDVLRPPLWTQHADFVNPFEFTSFLRQVQGLRPFDVMLEIKAKDLALLRLREDLLRWAPDLAAQVS